MDLFQILKTAAPVIASALTGPLGGIAVEMVSNALGLSDKTEEAIKTALDGGISPEQKLALQKANNDFLLETQRISNSHEENIYKTEVDDRASARLRESSVKDYVNSILAYSIVGGFIISVVGVLSGVFKIEDQATFLVLNLLAAPCTQVLSYYFGSTSGSKAKTEMLVQSAKKVS